MTVTADLLDRLGEKALEVRQLIHEANGVIKDLRHEIRDARATAKKAVEEEVAAEVTRQLDKLADEIARAREDAVQRTIASFDELRDTLLGVSEHRRKPGAPTLPELVHKIAAPHCPSCGSAAEAFTAVHGEGPPEPGMIAICWSCSSFNVYASATRLRLATSAEVEQAMKDPIVLKFLEERPNANNINDIRALIAGRGSFIGGPA